MRDTVALASCNDGVAKNHRIGRRSGVGRRPELRVPRGAIATFDNDGTLWCEKPMPIQLDFILRRLRTIVEPRPELAGREPWKALAEGDHAWFGALVPSTALESITKVKVLAAGILDALGGVSVEEFEATADDRDQDRHGLVITRMPCDRRLIHHLEDTERGKRDARQDVGWDVLFRSIGQHAVQTAADDVERRSYS